MYESYWQLESKPFEPTSDARFYYPSEVHQGVMLKLRYAIENRRAAALLTGDAGLGKTLMSHVLCRQLPAMFSPLGTVVFPHMPPPQLLAYLAEELAQANQEPGSTEMAHVVRSIEDSLIENAKLGNHAVIVVDESHLLIDTGSLEAIRLLLNIEHEGKPAMTVLLVGGTSMLPALDRMPQLESRIAIKCLARPFRLDETAAYVNHRMSAAGAARVVFDKDAVETLHQLTQGVPRRINRLCDLALLIGYAEELPAVTTAHLHAVAEELVTVSPE